ncbi:helix-turn-helix transcriptional regulator [Sphingosinicella humi]|nr:WYL domain-containing protein [Sphingosinicella humi]
MSKLDRLLKLVHALAEDAEGLTLDQMADRLEVNRRTAERMRNVIMMHFDLEPIVDGRIKRWRIVGRLGRMFTQPTAQELAAVQTEIDAQRKLGQHARADLLAGLLAKVRSAQDMQARTRIGPDLEALSRAQRTLISAGPGAPVPPETLEAVHTAISAGSTLEFDYRADGSKTAAWRRVIPYGVVHGPVSYLIGKIPRGSKPPVYYRLDRMENARPGNEPGVVPDDFDVDEFVHRSFGIYHDAEHDIVLRIKPAAAERARGWRFHPGQVRREDKDGSVVIEFRAGGLRELCDHLFCWGEHVEIIAPDVLREQMVESLTKALAAHQ